MAEAQIGSAVDPRVALADETRDALSKRSDELKVIPSLETVCGWNFHTMMQVRKWALGQLSDPPRIIWPYLVKSAAHYAKGFR